VVLYRSVEMRNREAFERLPEIRKIMNENGIHFMNHSGWYESRDFKDFEYEQYINGAWYAFQEQQKKIARLQSALDELKTTCERHNDPMWRGFANDYDKGFSDCAASLLDGINRITGTKE